MAITGEADRVPFIGVAIRAADAGRSIGEIMIASAYVLNARLELIGAAVRSPLDADFTELGRMVPEKVTALSRSGAAVFDRAVAAQRDLADQITDVGLLMLGAIASPTRLVKLAEDATQRGARALMWPVIAGGAAIAPVHRTVTANARRLRARAA